MRLPHKSSYRSFFLSDVWEASPNSFACSKLEFQKGGSLNFQIQFRESTAAGGKWCWCLWKPIPGGKVIMCSQHGFQTRLEAKKDWRAFQQAVASAERVCE
jgi:hypothetical protein